jgi:hypothetical protein
MRPICIISGCKANTFQSQSSAACHPKYASLTEELFVSARSPIPRISRCSRLGNEVLLGQEPMEIETRNIDEKRLYQMILQVVQCLSLL